MIQVTKDLKGVITPSLWIAPFFFRFADNSVGGQPLHSRMRLATGWAWMPITHRMKHRTQEVAFEMLPTSSRSERHRLICKKLLTDFNRFKSCNFFTQQRQLVLVCALTLAVELKGEDRVVCDAIPLTKLSFALGFQVKLPLPARHEIGSATRYGPLAHARLSWFLLVCCEPPLLFSPLHVELRLRRRTLEHFDRSQPALLRFRREYVGALKFLPQQALSGKQRHLCHSMPTLLHTVHLDHFPIKPYLRVHEPQQLKRSFLLRSPLADIASSCRVRAKSDGVLIHLCRTLRPPRHSSHCIREGVFRDSLAELARAEFLQHLCWGLCHATIKVHNSLITKAEVVDYISIDDLLLNEPTLLLFNESPPAKLLLLVPPQMRTKPQERIFCCNGASDSLTGMDADANLQTKQLGGTTDRGRDPTRDAHAIGLLV
mmetsp:Transcript_46161/g.76315  ORF Transcript_46161/g.76315 Transcript_46161/m.76315 type:complete len:430 (-) Transcript_46161:369-1658(-)